MVQLRSDETKILAHPGSFKFCIFICPRSFKDVMKSFFWFAVLINKFNFQFRKKFKIIAGTIYNHYSYLLTRLRLAIIVCKYLFSVIFHFYYHFKGCSLAAESSR